MTKICALFVKVLVEDATKFNFLEQVKFLDVTKQLEDKSFYIRLNSISSASDAVANDVIYHLECGVKVQRMLKQKATNIQEIHLISQVVSDIELLNVVQYTIDHPSGVVLDMNIINIRYKQLLLENGMHESDMKQNYKPYLKEIINDNIVK